MDIHAPRVAYLSLLGYFLVNVGKDVDSSDVGYGT
jgi:hypothetical protein